MRTRRSAREDGQHTDIHCQMVEVEQPPHPHVTSHLKTAARVKQAPNAGMHTAVWAALLVHVP